MVASRRATNCTTAPVFVDANVLAYQQDSSDPAKRHRIHDWLEHLVRQRTARVSLQVLQELYATLARKLKPTFGSGDRAWSRGMATGGP